MAAATSSRRLHVRYSRWPLPAQRRPRRPRRPRRRRRPPSLSETDGSPTPNASHQPSGSLFQQVRGGTRSTRTYAYHWNTGKVNEIQRQFERSYRWEQGHFTPNIWWGEVEGGESSERARALTTAYDDLYPSARALTPPERRPLGGGGAGGGGAGDGAVAANACERRDLQMEGWGEDEW